MAGFAQAFYDNASDIGLSDFRVRAGNEQPALRFFNISINYQFIPVRPAVF